MGVNDLRQLISGNYTLKDTNTIAIGIKSFAFPMYMILFFEKNLYIPGVLGTCLRSKAIN